MGKRFRAVRKRKRLRLGIGVSKVGLSYFIDSTMYIWENLGSDVEEVRIVAALDFAENSKDIAKATASIKDISTAQIMQKVMDVLRKNEEKVIEKILKEKKRKTLTFLANAHTAPKKIRETAKALLAKLPKTKAKTDRTPGYKAPEYKAPEIKHAMVFTPVQVKRLVAQLTSVDVGKRVHAAVHALKNHHAIVKTVAKMPDLNVTQFNKAVVQVVENNYEAILQQLRKAGMKPALDFLAKSHLFSRRIHQEAQKLIGALVEFGSPTSKPARAPVRTRKEPLHKAPEHKVEQELTAARVQRLVSQLHSPDKKKRVHAAVHILDKHHEIAKIVSCIAGLTISQVNQRLANVVERNLEETLKILEQQKMQEALYFMSRSHIFSWRLRRKAMGIFRFIRGFKRPGARKNEPI